ncbi:MAG: hypothetical protein ACLFWL_10040 [Candidatus Brocadiia bacterium]
MRSEITENGSASKVTSLVTCVGCLAMLLVFCGTALPEEGEQHLICNFEPTAEVFGLWEMRISFPEGLDCFCSLPETQIHDAYDADRDGVFIRITAEFSQPDRPPVVVPAFAMKAGPQKPWKWLVRWSPRRPGEWSVKVQFHGRAERDDEIVTFDQALPNAVNATDLEGVAGPLVSTSKKHPPGYLRMLRADGTSEATWLFGACRAWVVKSQDPNNDWSPHEWLDREKELFAPMRDGGFNLLNQWMAPWEYLIIHHDRAEHWRQPDGRWKRTPLPEGEKWTSYQYYDQGRCLAFDRLVKSAEGDADKKTIYLLLSPLPHQCLQVREHPWGSQESGWSPENDASRQALSRLNGLSGFKKNMSIWEFFEANPKRPLTDWRSRLFDHQANFFRYVIARWGYSRAVGVWVLVDELDAVGDTVGVMSKKKGWWAHPQCRTWLANIVRLFRGELTRTDGLRYGGDPFDHPLHAATTSFGGQAGEGSNLEWQGGPKDARPDLFGWHWYPHWAGFPKWNEIWQYTIRGVARYSKAPIGDAARLISEFGAPDRRNPQDTPSRLYPGLFHFAAWSAIFSGQAGIPMDWDDGKEFGELCPRDREGIFDETHYPIDHVEEVKALRRFLRGLSPDDIVRGSESDGELRCKAGGSVDVYALFLRQKRLKAIGWLFSPGGKGRFQVQGLQQGKYVVTWYDPWDGRPVADQGKMTVSTDGQGRLTVNPQPILQKIRQKAPHFPDESRLPRGHDVAFKIRFVEGG